MKLFFSFIAFTIIFTIVQIIKDKISNYKNEKKIDLRRPLPSSGFQLIRIVKSGVTESLTEVADHLMLLGTVAKLKCTESELLMAVTATLGFVVANRNMPEAAWSNETVYSNLEDHVNLVTKPLTSKNVECFELCSQNIIYLLSCILQSPAPSKNLDMICKTIINDIKNTDSIQDPERKKMIKEFAGKSIGEILMTLTQLAKGNDYLKEWGVE